MTTRATLGRTEIGRASTALAVVGVPVAAAVAPLWGGRIAAGTAVGIGLVAAGVLAAALGPLRRRAWPLAAVIGAVAAFGAVMVGALAVAVLAWGRLPDEHDRTAAAAVAAGAAAAALAFHPARLLLLDVIRRGGGHGLQPDQVVRRFGERASRRVADEELLLELAGAVSQAFGLSRTELWIVDGDVLEPVVTMPAGGVRQLRVGEMEMQVLTEVAVAGPAWLELWLPPLLEGRHTPLVRAVPARHSGELLGLIVAERASHQAPFTEREDSQLVEIARQLGIVLHNRLLDSALRSTLAELRHTNDQLRTSRARIAAAADAERRRIERDLHDGAQQHLVALAVNLRLARDLLEEDPRAADELLAQLTGDVRKAIDEVRNLAHGIYPPLLVEAGFVEALRAVAARSPIPVEVQLEATTRLPAPIEAAVYFWFLEALQNVAKHAAGSTATLRLTETPAGLDLEVVDDGPGFDTTSTAAGHGFENMSDRLGALGGTTIWDSAPGRGTRVLGRVPRMPA